MIMSNANSHLKTKTRNLLPLLYSGVATHKCGFECELIISNIILIALENFDKSILYSGRLIIY
jgi:hypothetical protein